MTSFGVAASRSRGRAASWAALMTTRCSPPRGRSGSRAATASPCRWEARTGGASGSGRSRAASRSAAARSGWTRMLAGSIPAYFRRTASSGARAAAGEAPHAPGEQLEVGVPDPGDVTAVGDVVVEHPQHVVLARLQRERPQHLVGTGRVLDEQDPQLRGASAMPAPRASAGATDRARSSRRGRTRPSRPAARQRWGRRATSSAVASAAAASAL